jgi:dTDP-4-dehydrorhamnose reductase
MAEAARTAGARFVHFSTDFVFNGKSNIPYGRDAAPDPLSVYGRTKLEGERRVAATAANALIIRTAWVYAADGANFVNTMLRVMRERGRVRVVADQLGSPTHASSLARATWALVAARARGIHHFTDAGIASWYDFAVAIAEEGGAAGLLDRAPNVEPIPAADYPTPARRPAYGVLDKQATWEAIGYIPAHWRTELRTMLKELKDIG